MSSRAYEGKEDSTECEYGGPSSDLKSVKTETKDAKRWRKQMGNRTQRAAKITPMTRSSSP